MREPLILWAHGAGVPSSSPWMQGWKERLARIGVVVSFDYPYARQGRKRPDPLERLIEAHRRALDTARAQHEGPVVLAGKSMGARVGCHVARAEPVQAVVCFGYPLVSPGKKAQRRDEVLRALQTPVLFVQGTRDRLCPLDELEEVRRRMVAPNELHVVEGGDHSLEISKRHARESGLTQQDVDESILEKVHAFLQRHLP